MRTTRPCSDSKCLPQGAIARYNIRSVRCSGGVAKDQPVTVAQAVCARSLLEQCYWDPAVAFRVTVASVDGGMRFITVKWYIHVSLCQIVLRLMRWRRTPHLAVAVVVAVALALTLVLNIRSLSKMYPRT